MMLRARVRPGAVDQGLTVELLLSMRATMDPYKRVILHIDLDCFYAQVESLRLGVGPGVPLAVQQWNNLIAGKTLCGARRAVFPNFFLFLFA